MGSDVAVIPRRSILSMKAQHIPLALKQRQVAIYRAKADVWIRLSQGAIQHLRRGMIVPRAQILQNGLPLTAESCRRQMDRPLTIDTRYRYCNMKMLLCQYCVCAFDKPVRA